MIIVRFIGGLGNQMFQYNLYRRLEDLNVSVMADLSDFENYDLHNGFELENIFELKLEIASQKELNEVKDSSLNVISRIRRKLFGQNKSHKYQHEFDLKSFDIKENLYLDGYWQAEDFLANNLSILHQDFSFKSKPNSLNTKLINEMQSINSVSIHVRRGDYLKLKDVYAECSKTYYQNSISFFQELYPDLKFYVFSNDIEWCRKELTFKNSDCEFINHNAGKQSFEDIRLMTNCKHNIIANSSFSWWGAILNKFLDKSVLCPENWFTNSNRNKDVYIPKNWIKIPNK
jgi:hypothetical protein